MLTTKEASEKYNISQGTLKNACARGDILAKKKGKTWIITSEKSLLKFIKTFKPRNLKGYKK